MATMRTDQFTVLKIFVFVVVVLLVAGGAYALLTPGQNLAGDMPAPSTSVPVVPAKPAPTAEEYQASARGVMAPFIAATANLSTADVKKPSGDFVQLVTITQQKLLEVTVPGDFRDQHLALVLLLDQWKRAVAGSVADQNTVIANTRATVSTQAWLEAPEPTPAP